MRMTLGEYLAERIVQARNEILDDMRAGIVPVDVTSFSSLHTYVDANEYGGFCDENIAARFPLPMSVGVWNDTWTEAQEAIHGWLADGGAVRELKG